jgi:hypothetical protein
VLYIKFNFLLSYNFPKQYLAPDTTYFFAHAYFPLQSIQEWLVQLEAMAVVLLHVCYSVALIGLLLLCIQRSICKITHLFRLVMHVEVADLPLTLT